ncbi:hypothetical protein CSC70_08380 [Pseudoxanthomonas kalamensis DSM 18571]|uniref:hypothetical protein n=1 Tax=Pseudoxanthomonas kalamensis TaxID=289483 RepID=UPI001390DD47|nr:hypothetical protein [Pseudoxanthomonas kalamensis]KAF1710656.1 hypothetical protein CSC70_08380 [Pseudoxanthomonas kalamensis DSM 18571]
MRKLGFILLFSGFAWLTFQQFENFMRAGLRHVGLSQYAKLSADPNHKYTEQDVRTHIRETALAVNEQFPVVLAPGFTMLAGGLLLALAKRRPQSQDAA